MLFEIYLQLILNSVKGRKSRRFGRQFAFDNPPFIPDFRLTNLRLAEDKYPVATADYFANDIYYKIEYAATVLDDSQTLLCLQ